MKGKIFYIFLEIQLKINTGKNFQMLEDVGTDYRCWNSWVGLG